ncbi:MAG: hypothetical protein NXH85_04555 [Pseudomonadaceae bacterium]|nr:hypothetical protein [Pseudomonadaceae bacterium]
MPMEGWIVLGLSQATLVSVLAALFFWRRSRPLAMQISTLQDNVDNAKGALAKARDQLKSAASALADDTSDSLELELRQCRTELDALKAHAATLEASSPTGEDESELKSLLQQFTQDSRDMLACIARLEAENKTLEDKVAELESS